MWGVRWSSKKKISTRAAAALRIPVEVADQLGESLPELRMVELTMVEG
jgi:hypothetical protein